MIDHIVSVLMFVCVCTLCKDRVITVDHIVSVLMFVCVYTVRGQGDYG